MSKSKIEAKKTKRSLKGKISKKQKRLLAKAYNKSAQRQRKRR